MQLLFRDSKLFLAFILITLLPIYLSCVKKSADGRSSDSLIPDPALETAIKEALGIGGRAVTDSDLAELTKLEVPIGEEDEMLVKSLEGLQHCVNLVELNLVYNDVSDLGPIADLTGLEMVYLMGNEVSDLGPIGNLTNLQQLSLGSNKISDISSLAGLTELTMLELARNEISDIDALAHLDRLEWLNLGFNNIQDIQILSEANRLDYLSLCDNQIEDIKPLVDNEGIDQGDEVDLAYNPLNEESAGRYLPLLAARGVDIDAVTKQEYGLN